MRINAPQGQMVIYTDSNGFESDRIHARKYLEVGNKYTVKETIVGSSYTIVFLKELPEERFNSVMFKEVEPILKEVETIEQTRNKYYKTPE